MSEREQTGGEIDFSDGELSEMNVDLAGREAQQPRKSRSMLRVPVDEVPRPQGVSGPLVVPDRASTEPSLPVMSASSDPLDDAVDHAFRNGGSAEAVVPATLHLAAQPAKDELEIFSAQLLAERDRDRDVELQMEDDETDPKALAQLRQGVVPQAVDDGPTRELRSQPRLSPALAALARAVAVPGPAAEGKWLTPQNAPQPAAPSTTREDLRADGVWSSAPPPEMHAHGAPSHAPPPQHSPPSHAPPSSPLPSFDSPPLEPLDTGETDDMELDDGELEEVEQQAPPPKPERQRTLTPQVIPPPPVPNNGDASHAISLGAQPSAPLPPSTSQPIAPPAMPPSVSSPHPLPPTPSGQHAVPPMPPTPSGQHAVPPMPPTPSAPHPTAPMSGASPSTGQHPPVPHSPSAPMPSGQHAVPPAAQANPPAQNGQHANGHAPPPSPTSPNASTGPINVNGAGAGVNGGAHPSPPPAPQAAPAAETALRPRRKRRAKQWFEEIFDDDYLRTLPFLTPRQTEREAKFISESLAIPSGGTLLDLACGYGRHAMELAANGFKVTGLDLSLPLLIRAADAARRVGVNVNFIHGDMREMTFENEFDGAYCMFTSFGYFDDDTNRKVAANLARAIKPGGKLLLDVANRDYLVRDLPTRVWWQGDGCVVLEEVDFNYFSSRLQTQRSIIFEDGRQVEQEISIRAYSLHEIGKVLHHSGFRVTEVSGGLSLRGKFFGADSRQLIVVAEKKLTP
jgi:SAM-dependent methyltransferase